MNEHKAKRLTLIRHANAEQEVLARRLSKQEATPTRLACVKSDNLRTAVAADPDERLRVETDLRELHSLLRTRQTPPPAAAGSADRTAAGS